MQWAVEVVANETETLRCISCRCARKVLGDDGQGGDGHGGDRYQYLNTTNTLKEDIEWLKTTVFNGTERQSKPASEQPVRPPLAAQEAAGPFDPSSQQPVHALPSAQEAAKPPPAFIGQGKTQAGPLRGDNRRTCAATVRHVTCSRENNPCRGRHGRANDEACPCVRHVKATTFGADLTQVHHAYTGFCLGADIVSGFNDFTTGRTLVNERGRLTCLCLEGQQGANGSHFDTACCPGLE
ncbi:MAG: hypothetical protein M1832_000487 [Thelocarpon impressellum]|nr:MAG: hypothetical protein M1832_000487 [Thelocarpon impressellum]